MKSRRLHRVGWLLGAIAWGMVSCKPGAPSGIIDSDDMEDILYDYQMALELASQNGGNAEAYTHQVFEKHKVTEEQFDSSLVWYTRHAYELRNVYENVETRLRTEAGALGLSQSESSIYSNLSAEGDTANIWRNSSFYVLTSDPIVNRVSFTFNADSTYRRGDIFSLNFQPAFRYQTGSKSAVCALTVHYEKDSTLTYSRTFHSFDDKIALRLECDTTLSIKKLTGFIYLVPEKNSNTKLLLINQLNLVRFHRPGIKDNESVQKNVQKADTLQTDTLQQLHPDTVRDERRLSPVEVRDKQPIEHRLDIVKEKKYVPPRNRQQQRRRNVQRKK